MKPLLVFATYEEALCTIQSNQFIEKTSAFFENDQAFLLLSGIGSFATYISLETFTYPYSCIYNIGLAGATSTNHSEGSILQIGNVSKETWHPRNSDHFFSHNTLSTITLDETQATSLLTCDKPVYAIEEMHKRYDVLDMEGYAVAYFAKKRQKHVTLFKFISDYCTCTTGEQIRQKITIYSAKICQYLSDIDIL